MEKYTRKAVDSTRIFTTHMTVNDLKRAVTKASLDSETRPRMKDVKNATYLQPSPRNSKCGPHKVLKYIQQRLRAKEWPVVLKALLLCHILLDEGSRGMVDLLLHSPFIFNLQEFRDASNPSAFDYSSYTRLFARYLQERIVTIRTLGAFYDTVRDPMRYSQQTSVFIQENNTIPSGQISTLDSREILKVMPVLENQLDVLTDVRLRSEELHNDLTIGVMERLVKDLLPLFNQLTQGVEIIQENFFTLSKSLCETSLSIYKKYIELVEKANSFITVANRLGATESNISLEHAPLDYVKGMEEHIATLSEGDKSWDTASEKKSQVDTSYKSAELQKAVSGDYDEEAALAAAIKASLQDSGTHTMISFDDSSDEEIQSEGATLGQQKNSIDDFFGIVSEPQNTSDTVMKQPSKEWKTKDDNLLDLLSDMNFNQQQSVGGFPSSGQALVPHMQTTRNLFNAESSMQGSVQSTLPPPTSTTTTTSQQRNETIPQPSPFQDFQGYYSTVGGMNMMMPMFPGHQGMMNPNMMMMTPYMTYGGPGTWSAMPFGGYSPAMYMQYNSLASMNQAATPAMQPNYFSIPNYYNTNNNHNMGAKIPGTDNSPTEHENVVQNSSNKDTKSVSRN